MICLAIRFIKIQEIKQDWAHGKGQSTACAKEEMAFIQ